MTGEFAKTTSTPSAHDSSHESDGLQQYLQKWGATLVPSEFFQSSLPSLHAQFPTLFYKGDLQILERPAISVVGTRNPTPEGAIRAKRVTAILVEMGFVIVSGLAKGIDTVAHRTALEMGGLTAAILGTPIHKIYPAENRGLAKEIETKAGIILSAAAPHEETGRYLFPRRNRLMAMLSRATIIIEAGETSGVIHQAAECQRQQRLLLLLKSLAENPQLSWPAGFVKSGAIVVDSPEDLRARVTPCLT
ncbi:MAG: DNA-processing protein DprA [Deltaproteobacteria bacterium]|nr:DNA-processing protein DprA [Deltaproteobacteria bacterium]